MKTAYVIQMRQPQSYCKFKGSLNAPSIIYVRTHIVHEGDTAFGAMILNVQFYDLVTYNKHLTPALKE